MTRKKNSLSLLSLLSLPFSLSLSLSLFSPMYRVEYLEHFPSHEVSQLLPADGTATITFSAFTVGLLSQHGGGGMCTIEPGGRERERENINKRERKRQNSKKREERRERERYP